MVRLLRPSPSTATEIRRNSTAGSVTAAVWSLCLRAETNSRNISTSNSYEIDASTKSSHRTSQRTQTSRTSANSRNRLQEATKKRPSAETVPRALPASSRARQTVIQLTQADREGFRRQSTEPHQIDTTFNRADFFTKIREPGDIVRSSAPYPRRHRRSGSRPAADNSQYTMAAEEAISSIKVIHFEYYWDISHSLTAE